MAYERSQMLYDDGNYYKWAARADHDNPYYRGGTDAALLNKTEGYEVLYFINHLASKHWTNPGLSVYYKIERMIKESPGHQKHFEKAKLILDNWEKY